MLNEDKRLAFHETLVDILGSRNVYFQPPATISMNYPCIVYNYEDDWTLHANNEKYFHEDKYVITYITKVSNPESVLTSLEALPYCSFNRHFTNDNLHHFSFTVYLRKIYERN